jgi:hypothetical protein
MTVRENLRFFWDCVVATLRWLTQWLNDWPDEWDDR